MSDSKLEICNTALLHLGQQRITSISDTSERGITVVNIYESSKRNLLSSHPWNFAKKRMELSKTGNTPEMTYSYEYPIPSDCLRILRFSSEEVYSYSVENGMVLTDDPDLRIVYIFDQTDTSKFSPQFDEALALSIALKVTFKFNTSSSHIQVLKSLYDEQLALARSADAQEGTSPGLNPNEFLLSRRGLANTSVDITRNLKDGEI